ncbi:MAG TPA: TolC family protein [Myxococcales bacterium]|nr:TolC family protein [Myxococcales bacterium]
MSVHFVLAVALVMPSVLTMDDALKLFRERGFDLLLSDAQVAAARGDERAAHAVANPQLGVSAGKSFDYDPGACPGCSATAFSVGLTDPSALSDLFTGKRGLRIDTARAALAAARKSRDDALRTLSLQVRQAMLDAALQTAQRDFALELADSSGKTLALVQKRFDAGAISEAELSRVEVAALEALQAGDLAEQQARAARLQIAYLLGVREILPDFAVDPMVLTKPLPQAQDTLDSSSQQAIAARPDLLAAQQQVERAQAALTLARRQRIPDVAVSAQYNQEGSGNSALQPPTLTIGLQLGVPVFYQQQGEIAHAEADVRTQQLTFEKARAQALLDVQSAHAAAAANRKLVERMQARLLDRAKRARDLVQVQYEKGAASLLDLLDAQRTWAQTHAEYLKDLHDFWLATYQLDAAVGKT